MDFAFTPQESAFAAEAAGWLAGAVPDPPLPSMDTREGFAAHRDWERRLFDAGWSVVSWPARYGGRDASLVEWLLFEEAYYAAGAPGRVSQNGIYLLAPTLFAFGTDEQRERFLPRMASGEDIWAQAWSEPGAGSDLAALRSRAVRVPGGWRLSGLKTWSSRAAFADWMFGLFRSDPEADRHRGLTYFLLPLSAEGVTVRPIGRLDGDPGFAEIALQDVFVPDADVLGGVGDGWAVAMATTTSERGLTLRSPGRFMATADRLLALAGEHGRPADDVVDAWVDTEAYRLHTLQTAARLAAGATPGAESSLAKLFWSELDIRLHEAALRVLGPGAELARGAPGADDGGRWGEGYQFALAGPIYAGTNEIQRNIVAERVLGLPRG